MCIAASWAPEKDEVPQYTAEILAKWLQGPWEDVQRMALPTFDLDAYNIIDQARNAPSWF
jgi:hypothetical protein